MSAANQVHVVPIQKLGHDVSAERERDSAIVFPPSLNVLVGVGPQQVTKQPRVRHVRGPHDAPDLFHRLQVGRQTTVAAKDFVIDDGGDRQAVEAVRERLPKTDAEPFFALFVKSVDTNEAAKNEDQRKETTGLIFCYF